MHLPDKSLKKKVKGEWVEEKKMYQLEVHRQNKKGVTRNRFELGPT